MVLGRIRSRQVAGLDRGACTLIWPASTVTWSMIPRNSHGNKQKNPRRVCRVAGPAGTNKIMRVIAAIMRVLFSDAATSHGRMLRQPSLTRCVLAQLFGPDGRAPRPCFPRGCPTDRPPCWSRCAAPAGATSGSVTAIRPGPATCWIPTARTSPS
jgi:hypothetical protein